jgi:Clp amino terminal domain, pathogenicity island component
VSSSERLCRLAQDAADAEDPLRALETLVELRMELEAVTRAQVQRGLRAGRSFGDIAGVLGISRQAAHRRYRDLAVARVRATKEARRVVRLAGEEALASKAPALASEHVLIAVLRCGGDAAVALRAEGVTLERARASAREIAAARRGPATPGETTVGLRDLLRDATRVVAARGGRWLDAGALLTAALAEPEAEGGACRLLPALEADPAAVRARLEGLCAAPRPARRNARLHQDAA